MKFHWGNLTQKIEILIQPCQDICVWHGVLSGRSELPLSHLQPVHQARSTLPGRQQYSKWGQFTRTVRFKYCCWVIEDIESKIHIRSHARVKIRNFKIKGHQVVIRLYGSLGSITFVFAPFCWAGFQFALGTRWCRTKRDVSEILLLRCTPCLSGAGTFFHY